jgi:hypothetical protein
MAMGEPIITVRQGEASIQEMRDLFERKPGLVAKATKTGISRAGTALKKRVQENIFSKFKRDTGDLARDPRARRALETEAALTVQVTMAGKAFYARFLEEGLQAERKKTAMLSSFSRYINQKRSRKYYRLERKRPFNLPARPFFDPVAEEANAVVEEQVRKAVLREMDRL